MFFHTCGVCNFEIAPGKNTIFMINSALQWEGQIGASVSALSPFPPTERVGITQYSSIEDPAADFISANGILSGGEGSSGRKRVITKLGERMTLISPTNVAFWSTAAGVNVAPWMQQHSGMAEPCSLTLQRGRMGCKELNRQASTLQRGVKKGGDIQLGRCKTGQ